MGCRGSASRLNAACSPVGEHAPLGEVVAQCGGARWLPDVWLRRLYGVEREPFAPEAIACRATRVGEFDEHCAYPPLDLGDGGCPSPPAEL